MTALAAPAMAQTSAGIPGLLAAGVTPELVQEGFVFTEGPVATADGGLYFSDIRTNRTYYLDPGGKIGVVRENTSGANGLALTKDGELLFAEGDGKRITRRNKDGTITVLTEGPPGVPLLAPNDLIVDAKGGIYFTDPGPRPVVPGRPTYVYYLPAGSRTPVLIDGAVARPNGLTLSLDGRTLIVDDTLNITVFAYDVQPDGNVKNKRPFLQLRDIPAGQESGADGLAIDHDGPPLHHDPHGRPGVRRQGRVPWNDQGRASARQRGVRRTRQTDALHHGARGAVPGEDDSERAGPAGEVRDAEPPASASPGTSTARTAIRCSGMPASLGGGHRRQAAGSALQIGAIARLGEGEEPGCAGCDEADRGPWLTLTMEMSFR